jgi:hypothetical protein
MESAGSNRGAWSRRLLIVLTALTIIGLIGMAIDFLGAFAAFPLHGGGCGGMAGVLLLFLVMILIAMALIGGLALVGLILLWERSRWGPLLLVPSNLLAMGFFGWWNPVNKGQLVWATTLLILAAAPAIAAALALWPLLTRGRLWVRAIETLILGLIALPLVQLFIGGMTVDIQTGLAAPPPQVASSGGSGCAGASAGLPAYAMTP